MGPMPREQELAQSMQSTPGQDPSPKLPGHQRAAGCSSWITQPGHYQLVREALWGLGQKLKNLAQALPHEPLPPSSLPGKY